MTTATVERVTQRGTADAASPAKSMEKLAEGDLDTLLSLADEVVRHGDDVFLLFTWEDPTRDPDDVAPEFEARMREVGFVPAEGYSRMVEASPDDLKVFVNYREQSPELGILVAIVAGLGLLGLGFFLFREQIKEALGDIAMPLLVGGVAVLGLITLAIAAPRMLPAGR